MVFRPKGSKETFSALGMVGGFGFMMGGTTVAAYLIGSFLDNRFDTSPWLLITFLIMGIIAGFMEFFQFLKKIINKKDI